MAFDDKVSRLPTAKEKEQLAKWLLTQGFVDFDDAMVTVKASYAAVFDKFVTGGLGWSGKVLVIVWDGGPDQFNAFTWERDGIMQHRKWYQLEYAGNER